jgi:hypothetical protein
MITRILRGTIDLSKVISTIARLAPTMSDHHNHGSPISVEHRSMLMDRRVSEYK